MVFKAFGIFCVMSLLCIAGGNAFRPTHNLKKFAVEGTCNSPQELPGQLASNLNLTWVTSVPKWNIVYGSRLFWFQDAEVCLGRAPTGFAELTRMCLKTQFDLNTTTTCFGKSVTQDCSFVKNNGNPYASCFVSAADSGTSPELLGDFKKRVVLTDNRTFALFVRCADGLKSYYIVSVKPQLSHFVILKCISKIHELGFDVRKFTKIPTYCGKGRHMNNNKYIHF